MIRTTAEIQWKTLLVFLSALAVLMSPASSIAGDNSRNRYVNSIFQFQAAADPYNVLRIILKWNTLYPSTCSVEYRSLDSPSWRPLPSTNEGTTTSHHAIIVGLKPLTYYAIRVTTEDNISAYRICRTHQLPNDIPAAEHYSGTLEGDNLIISGLPYPISKLIAVNGSGEIVWYHQDKDFGDPGQILLKANSNDGRLYYNILGAIKAVDFRGQEEIILNTYAFGENCHHDFLITPEETFMYLTHETSFADQKRWCTDTIVERDQSGNLIWQWKSSDHMDMLGGYAVTNSWQQFNKFDCGLDLTHSNAIDLVTDSEGNKFVLLSIRNLNRILKINYNTGEIEWQFGEGLDFEDTSDLTEDLLFFSRQHSSKMLPDGSLMLFDNANDRCSNPVTGATGNSRCLIYSLDEVKKEANIIWNYDLMDFAPHAGHIKAYPDSTYIITFPINPTYTYSSLIKVDAQQNSLWECRFYYPNQVSTNFMLSNLEIESLYDLDIVP